MIFLFSLLLGFHPPSTVPTSYTVIEERGRRETEFAMSPVTFMQLRTGWDKFNQWEVITIGKILPLIPCSPRDQNTASTSLQMPTDEYNSIEIMSKPDLNIVVIYAYSIFNPEYARTLTLYTQQSLHPSMKFSQLFNIA